MAGFTIQAQNGNRLEALKIAYITNKLNLSPEEAQKFWPIYNQYSLELKVARLKAINNKSSEIELDENLLNIRKKYSVEFTKAISPGKVNDFFRAERDFNALVQKEQQRRLNQRRPFPGP